MKRGAPGTSAAKHRTPNTPQTNTTPKGRARMIALSAARGQESEELNHG